LASSRPSFARCYSSANASRRTLTDNSSSPTAPTRPLAPLLLRGTNPVRLQIPPRKATLTLPITGATPPTRTLTATNVQAHSSRTTIRNLTRTRTRTLIHIRTHTRIRTRRVPQPRPQPRRSLRPPRRRPSCVPWLYPRRRYLETTPFVVQAQVPVPALVLGKDLSRAENRRLLRTRRQKSRQLFL